MKLAVLFEDDKIFVEFQEEKFRELFKSYFKEYKDIDKTFDAIIMDLRRKQMNT